MITMEMITKSMTEDLSKFLSVTPEEIKQQIEDGEIYVFDLSGLLNFYDECDLDPITTLCKDLENKDIALSNNLYFMPADSGWGNDKLVGE